MDLKKLSEECIKSAIDYGIAAYEIVENSSKTNKAYDKSHKNYKKLKSFGKEGIDELLNQLNHTNDYVRYAAATYLLSVKNEIAMDTLKELSKKSGVFGFTVKMFIKEWDKGNLRDYLS